MKRKMLLLTLAMPLFLCPDAQAQTASRLTARANWNHDGATFVQNDSTVYNYASLLRGGDLTHTMKHDNSTTWLYVGFTSFQNQFQTLQEFDAKNNLTATINLYWSGTNWIKDSKTVYIYDTAGRIESTIKQTWGGAVWVNISKEVNIYNDADKLASRQLQFWNSTASSFDSTFGSDYYYDVANNNLLTETTYMIMGGTRSYMNQYSYTYSSTNQVLTENSSVSLTGNILDFVNNWLVTNSYDSSGNRTTQLSQGYDATSGTWVNDSLRIYTNFVNHMPKSELIQFWNNTGAGMWVNKMNYTYTYNSFDQLTSSTGESWNAAGIWEFASSDPRSIYYYGTYTNVTSVKGLVNNHGDANIYPVPSQNTLHIDLKWENAQAATIAIYDMTGRTIMNWDAPYGTEYKSAISVASLAAGNYFIKINGTHGQIVKQIVVAH